MYTYYDYCYYYILPTLPITLLLSLNSLHGNTDEGDDSDAEAERAAALAGAQYAVGAAKRRIRLQSEAAEAAAAQKGFFLK